MSGEVELLACPFCGAKAKMITPASGGAPYVLCERCHAGGPVSRTADALEAARAWNRRAPPPRREEESERVPFDEDVLFWAFRYALGRMTYAVSDVAMALHAHKGRISPRMREMICREITAAEQRGALGHQCDVETWAGVRAALAKADAIMGEG